MPSTLLSLRLADLDPAAVRARSREVAQLAGLETLQQTRMATAVSEIARNALEHARGAWLDFRVEAGGTGQCLVAEVRDEGPGIADLDAAYAGRALPSGRVSAGIPGSRRLVDRMSIDSTPQGTRVRLEMDLPRGARHLSADGLARLAAELARLQPVSPVEELQQQNRELLRIHQELRANQVALEQADERKNQFVTTLAHELRTPLSTLELNLELLRRKRDATPDEMLARYAVMGRQTRQMARLVEDLMDAARVSQGKVQLDQQPAELNALVAGAVEMTHAAMAAKSHQLEVQLSPVPLWVSADTSRLTQVVCNLLQNAARYTAAGGRIGVAVEGTAREGVVQVVDNGIGIPGDLLPHVFDLFVQGDPQAPGAGGLGIGLTLVRHLVAAHGGAVSVASAGSGLGSTFTFRLPLIAQPEVR